MWVYLKANWKTSLLGFCAFVMSVEQFVTALQAWQAGQVPNWHGAIVAIIIAALGLAAKDGNNHSTQAQVEKATLENK